MEPENKWKTSLLLLRWSVFLVMLMWTLDKFIRPEHASGVFQNFYYFPELGEAIYFVFGGIEFLILIAFLVGFFKTFTYGAVLFFHAISTLSSFHQYFHPFENLNLLFFAAWPMLVACLVLFWFRNEDTYLTMPSSHHV